MTTVQLAAWDGVRRGAVDAVSAYASQTAADAALAQLMLCRRRAVTATVLDEFFSAIGRSFAPREGGHEQLERAREIAAAREAADIVASNTRDVGALCYERAIVARMEGRTRDAMRDMEIVLTQRPAFVAAAIEAARLKLAHDAPLAAVLALAPVEQECRELRAGSAVLADALRAMGRPDDASRYDLAALLATGYRDGRGNNCAPDDVFGRPVTNRNMPAAFEVMHLPDGRFLMNDRGHYYIAAYPLNQVPLAELLTSLRPVMRSGSVPQGSARRRPMREGLDYATMWSRLHVGEKLSSRTAELLRKTAGRLARMIQRVAAPVQRAVGPPLQWVLGPGLRRLGRLLMPAYKALPESMRIASNRYLLPPVLRGMSYFISGFELLSLGEGRRIADQFSIASKIRVGAAEPEFELPDREAELNWVERRQMEGIARIITHSEPSGSTSASDVAAQS